jgi:predicted RNase H-like nuclease
MRHSMRMYFVGLDLAWGEKSHTGVAVIDPGGRLLHVGSAQDDASIDAAIAPYVSDECLVAIDAPLIVPNAEGRRIAEIELGKDFMRFDAGPHSANKANPLFDPPRGAVLCARLDLDMDPESRAERRAIEVFPHPATVVLFRLPKILKYKKGEVEDRRRELLQLMTLIEGLDKATPRLRVNHNVAWVELRNRIAAATRQVQLDRDEDPVDAVVCAYVALYRFHRPDDVTTYGDFASGYIITPTLPSDLTPAPGRRPAQQSESGDVLPRLEQVQALIERAQRELTAIRRQLGG